MVEKRFTNKVVVVTGATKGIGLACAERLKKEGAIVCAIQRGHSSLFDSFEFDLSKEQDCFVSVDAIIKKHGHIDALINNAGMMKESSILDTSLEEEQMLNFWVLFGATYTWKEIMAYNGREEVSDFTKDLVKEVGVIKMAMLTIRSIIPFFQVLRNLRSKKKKWPFVFPNELMEISVTSLREEYGIKILTPEEREVKKIQWSGSILE